MFTSACAMILASIVLKNLRRIKMGKIKRKNQPVTIYIGKERVLCVPFKEINLNFEKDGNYLYLEAFDEKPKDPPKASDEGSE